MHPPESCGILAGSVGIWNEFLDSAVAFKTLLAAGSGLQVVNITDPDANLGIDLQGLNDAKPPPKEAHG